MVTNLWHCEGFVDCLELSVAQPVLESYEDVVAKTCTKVSYFSFSSCVNFFEQTLSLDTKMNA